MAAVAANHGAKAAVDVALHDLVARRRGVSLPVLLGGTTLRVPTDVTLAAGDADALAGTARARAADGFGVLKMKVGTDAATDVARVRAVREAVGPDVRIRLDANQGWTARDAVRVISGLEDAGLDVELVEQPVAAADLDGLAWVTARVRTPVMADESVYGVRDLVEVVRRRAADLVNVKLAKCGGLRVAATLLELARAQGMGSIVGSMMETHIGVGAAASLVAACGTSAVSDLDAAWWAASSPVVGGMTYDGPVVVLPDAPGLGIDALAGRGRMSRPHRLFGDPSMREVAVPVATLWRSPDAPRAVDEPAVRDRPDVAAWAEAMDQEVRLGLHGRTETQLLLGEPAQVLEERDGWSRVAALYQAVVGARDRLRGLGAHRPPRRPGPRVARGLGHGRQPIGGVRGRRRHAHPVVRDDAVGRGAGEETATLHLPDGRLGVVSLDDLRLGHKRQQPLYGADDVLAAASQFLGLRYLWGGTSTWGLDCSGLVHLTLRSLAVLLPRDAHDQAACAEVEPVPLDEVRPGDLYFFARPGRRVYHVGFVTSPVAADGTRWMLHAPEGGELIENAPLAPHRVETLVSAGRVRKPEAGRR